MRPTACASPAPRSAAERRQVQARVGRQRGPEQALAAYQPAVAFWQSADDTATLHNRYSTTAGKTQLPKHPPTVHRRRRPGQSRQGAIALPTSPPQGTGGRSSGAPCPGSVPRSGRRAGGHGRPAALPLPPTTESRLLRRHPLAGDRRARQAAYSWFPCSIPLAPNGEAQPPRGLKRRVSTTPQARRRRLLQ